MRISFIKRTDPIGDNLKEAFRLLDQIVAQEALFDMRLADRAKAVVAERRRLEGLRRFPAQPVLPRNE
jgi:hypothetical protein